MKTIKTLQVIPRWSVFLILVGLLTLLLYFNWWFRYQRLTSPWLFIGFLIAMGYSGCQIIGAWVLYLAAHYSDRRRL